MNIFLKNKNMYIYIQTNLTKIVTNVTEIAYTAYLGPSTLLSQPPTAKLTESNAKLLFLLIKLIVMWRSRNRLRRPCLRVPVINSVSDVWLCGCFMCPQRAAFHYTKKPSTGA